jgi:hypothetical protein
MNEYQYGYYQYKDIKTSSKYEIMRLCDDPTQVTWHYHDEYFSSFDWSKPPADSIDTLYRKRCEQLRSSYDYIVLMYSGGSDSQNILDCFVKNNIHLDEICSHINYEGSIVNNDLNYEILGINGAKQIAEHYIQQHNLKTIYRLYDVTQKTIEVYNNYNFDMNFNICNSGAPIAMTKPKASNILNTNVKLWKDLYNSGKKICFIWGNHKPIVVQVDHQWFFSFRDNMQLHSSPIINTSNAIDEAFYQNPCIESVNIMIKQSHLIKNNLSIPLLREYLKLKQSTYKNLFYEVAVYVENGKRIVMAENDLKKIIYPNSKVNIKTYNKQSNNFLNTKDKWFWKSNTHHRDIFINTIRSFTDSINNQWIKSYDPIYHLVEKLVTLSSKRYYL